MEITGGLILLGVLGVTAAARFLGKKADAENAGVPTKPVGAKEGGLILTPESIIRLAAAKYNQDPALMLAIAKKESSFNPLAINTSDPSYGLFQIQIFWLKYFGYSVPASDADALDYTKNILFQPEIAADVAARILKYFRGRQNPLTGDTFQFPADVDIYNVGETLWAKGRRNLAYRDAVTKYYREFQ